MIRHIFCDLDGTLYNDGISDEDVKAIEEIEKEVDFVAIRREEKIYVQVTYQLGLQATIDREFAPLLAIDDHYPKYVVSMDDLWQDNIEGVKHRHIADFLLDEW